jgi:hypothetical protein
VLRWPAFGGGGDVLFDLASGWCLEAHSWRLTEDARARARALAEAEGLTLPRIRRTRPRRNIRLPAIEARTAEPVDPRQTSLPLT